MTADVSKGDSGTALPLVLAMTGASGAVYATRLLESLLCKQVHVQLCMSGSALSVIQQELGFRTSLDGSNIADLLAVSDEFLGVKSNDECTAASAQVSIQQGRLSVFHHGDYFTPMASGSALTRGMVICPCSGSTLSAIAHAASNNLIQRAADVHLKERRKLVVVPRETPLNSLQLENMLRLSREGVVVLPASPGWYHGVLGLKDLVDFVVARILDQFGLSNTHMQRWSVDLPAADNGIED